MRLFAKPGLSFFQHHPDYVLSQTDDLYFPVHKYDVKNELKHCCNYVRRPTFSAQPLL